MPLPDSRAQRVRERITTRLPAASFAVVTPAGQEGTLLGYLDDRRGGLDALGQPERDARIYLPPDQEGNVQRGDMLDDRWVAWTVGIPEGDWLAIDLRRLPPFESWTRTTRTLTGRNPTTDAPIYTETDTLVDAYLIEARAGSQEAPGELERTTSGVIVTPGSVDTLQVGDRIEHPVFGRYRIASVTPYGPWARATVEAA